MNRVKEELLKKTQNYKNVIWDWNGTLLDDSRLVHQTNVQILEEHGLPTISYEQYRECFSHPVQNYYENLGFDFSKVSFAEIGHRFVELYRGGIAEVELFEGVKEVLSEIDKISNQFILSAAQHEHVNEAAQQFGVKHFFDDIFGIADHLASSKVGRGYELMQEKMINSKETLMIGDTDHDYEVAEALGVDIVLIPHGHQSREVLLKATPNVL